MAFIQWERLLFHVLEELAVYEEDPIVAERHAVHLYTAIFQRFKEQS